MRKPTIGVIGGAGPLAGVEFVRRIYQRSKATKDQEHPRVLLWSSPADLPDRSSFLLGQGPNPAAGFAQQLVELHAAGATVVGMACVTAHAPAIYNEIVRLHEGRCPRLLSMVDETVRALSEMGVKKVGLLSSKGTTQARIFENAFSNTGLIAISPGHETRERVHNAIYGLKQGLHPPYSAEKREISLAIEALADLGAEVIVLACTELPLLVDENTPRMLPLLDPMTVLADALLEMHAQQHLSSAPC